MKKMTWMIVITVIVFVGTMEIIKYQKSCTHSYTTVASWYGKKFHGRTMANGEKYNMYSSSVVAHKTLPFGTEIRVTNPKNSQSLALTVKDRGPYIIGREFDLSYAGAKKLDLIKKGTGLVKVEIFTSEKFYFYRIKSKETLWRLFGHNWSKIATLNNISPEEIKKGMKIIVPYNLDSDV